nr:hypothetical protein CFP56_74445 [Quercus suber]
MQEVRSTRTAYLRSVAPRPPHSVTNTRHNIRWTLPPWPNLKVNFDGFVFRDDNRAGVGVSIRDWNGQMVASMAKMFPLPILVTAVEVIATTKALYFANDLDLSSVVLEGDSKITIDALAGEKKKSKKSSNQAASIAKVSVVADKFIHTESRGSQHLEEQSNTTCS